MKSAKFLIPALALIVTVGACQNRSSETGNNDSTMPDDSSMSMESMDSMNHNEMMSAMNGMMDGMHQMMNMGAWGPQCQSSDY